MLVKTPQGYSIFARVALGNMEFLNMDIPQMKILMPFARSQIF